VAAGILALLLFFAIYEAIYREIFDAINLFLYDSTTNTYTTPSWVGWIFHKFLPLSIATISCVVGATIAIRGLVGRGTTALVIVTPVALIPAIYLAFESIRYNGGYGTVAHSAMIGFGAALFMAIVVIIAARNRLHWRTAIRHRSNAA